MLLTFLAVLVVAPQAAHAAGIQVSGVLRDADTGAPISNACVLAVPEDGVSPRQSTNVNGDASWTITAEAPFDLAFYTVANGNCGDLNQTIESSPVPSWWQNQAFTSGTTPNDINAPKAVTPFAAGTSGVTACLGATALPTKACQEPTTELSGAVITTRSRPVEFACVFVLADLPNNPLLALALTDAAGQWHATGLPVGVSMVVGVVPPFGDPPNRCQSQGPPPMPGPGELQPEFYRNTWIDLTNPQLGTDPFGYAVSQGATVLDRTTSGIDTCLTSTPGNIVPRPACVVSQPTPTASTATAAATPTPTTTSAAPTAISTSPSGAGLAATGASTSLWTVGGFGLIAVGLILLWAAGFRRARGSHR